jgi:hypothetical protein
MKFGICFYGYLDTSPDITLILNATIAVLNANAISPCAHTMRRMRFEEISTSDTWKVMPYHEREVHKIQVIGVFHIREIPRPPRGAFFPPSVV